MQYRCLLMALIIFMLSTTIALADPLLLSNAEMQKLQQYFPAQQDSGTQVVWKGDPITLDLPIGKEKRLLFPTHVTFDAKGALTTDEVRIINNDKSLYLTALKPIPITRIYVTLQDTNEVVLLDIATSEKADNTNTIVSIQQNNTNQSAVKATVNNNQTTSDEVAEDPKAIAVSDNDAYVTLTRFAWQQLYAPERLLSNPLGIMRAPMHTQKFLSNLIYGDKVVAHPMVSWVYHNTYITAIELRNKYPLPTRINLERDLCGDWQAATLYPRHHLKPAGDKLSDSTMLFLISAKPFGDSMGVCDGRA